MLAALINSGAALDMQDRDGWTALMLAASGGHLAALRALLRGSASVDLVDTAGCTALHHVVLGIQAGANEVVLAMARELLVSGCPLGAVNTAGKTAVMIAESRVDRALCKELTEAMGGLYMSELPACSPVCPPARLPARPPTRPHACPHACAPAYLLAFPSLPACTC
jgi:hypothetical protein